MKDTPILMSGPMVRAYLAGLKTHTRRAIKNADWFGCPTGDCPHEKQSECDAAMVEHCPYGKPGDRLWFKETWRTRACFANKKPSLICVHDAQDRENWPWLREENIEYAADGKGEFHGKLRPSIFMPRWASRVTADLLEVRWQRLQDITPEDAEREGLKKLSKDQGRTWKYGIPGPDGLPATEAEAKEGAWPWHLWRQSPVDAYRYLWESINGPGSWEANPYVWVLTLPKWKGGDQ